MEKKNLKTKESNVFSSSPYSTHAAYELNSLWALSGSYPYKTKKNPLSVTETGTHSGSGNHTTPGGVRFDFQAVSFEDFCHEYKRLICKQSADYLLFYFQLFCCRWLLFPPLFDDFFLRDIFFMERKKKC